MSAQTAQSHSRCFDADRAETLGRSAKTVKTAFWTFNVRIRQFFGGRNWVYCCDLPFNFDSRTVGEPFSESLIEVMRPVVSPRRQVVARLRLRFQPLKMIVRASVNGRDTNFTCEMPDPFSKIPEARPGIRLSQVPLRGGREFSLVDNQLCDREVHGCQSEEPHDMQPRRIAAND